MRFNLKPPAIILQVPWLPDNTTGLTICFIILVTDMRLTRTITHELEHIRQQWREPIIFYFKYIYYHFKYGYKQNPYEIAARKAAGQRI